MKENLLQKLIKEKIKKEGPIPFDEFMNMVLYEPEVGYYMRKDLKIGREGDFFTASHLGKAFGILLSEALIKLWNKLGCPKNFSITEIGPAMGYLAEDILEEFFMRSFSSQIDKYVLIEINPTLIEHQKERLKKYQGKTIWYSSIKEVKPINGIVIVNEIYDAFPVRIFEIRNHKAFEIYVTLNEKDDFMETLIPARQETIAYLEEFAPQVFQIEGYRSEVNLMAKEFTLQLSKLLQKGYILIFDYGFEADEYFAPFRKRGTLMCYYKHTLNENPYIKIGQQDMTSHVNFSALKKWAKEVGFKIESFTSQSKFLVSLCDETLLERLHKERLTEKFKRLILPQGMGESHKVLVLSKS